MKANVSFEIDGKRFSAPAGISIKEALKQAGHRVVKFPQEGALFAPCEMGGCWSCAVEVDGESKPACTTPVEEGLKIKTDLGESHIPKRVLFGFGGHSVGGVGTPWWLKSQHGYIEVACFAAGCNFRCPQCQNWEIAFKGKGKAFSPREAARLMTDARKKYRVDRMAISGGESTLNRKWLVQYVTELKRLNPDPEARIHVDTNASILTRDYIDELIEAGMTDIGPDLKGLHLETFMRITGFQDATLAAEYLKTSWNAVNYLSKCSKEKLFVGIGIPYNRAFISLAEIEEVGERLYEMDPEVQVCILDFRPEYRRTGLVRPTFEEMTAVHDTLTGVGLKTVICPTEYGYIGPEKLQRSPHSKF